MHRLLILSFILLICMGSPCWGQSKTEVEQAKADEFLQSLSEGKIGRFKPIRLAEGITLIERSVN